MRRLSSVMLAVGLALAIGCKNKDAGTPGGGSAQGSATGGSAAPSATGTGPARTAAGSGVEELPVVTDCPKSLGGTEKVARTIKKACGPITVTDSLTVEGSLTLEAGVVLKFAPETELVIGYNHPAKLIVQGGAAADQRVVFTSAGDQAAGVWKGVTLHDGSDRSQITGLDIAFAGVAGSAALTLHDAVDITYTNSSIKHAKEIGLATRRTSSFAQFTGNQFSEIPKVAISVEPSVVGTLGANNTFDKDAFVEIRGGKLDGDATWKNIGAPYRVAENVAVDTATTPVTLTITDASLAFASDAELSIGYHSRGKLRITGPAVLTSIDGKPGTWNGVRIYDHGEATIENATFSSGGSADSGALTAKRGGKLTLGEVTFKDNKHGLWVDDQATLSAPKPLTFSGNERAARVSTTGFGALTGANVFADNEIIEISGAALHASTTWLTQPKATVQVLENVTVDGSFTLTISAGGTYQWKGGTALVIGYNTTGTLKVAGRADARVTFTAIAGGEPWNGVHLESEARGVDLSYLDLADVTGDAGVIAKRDAAGKLANVTCARCAAVVAPACGSKLDTSTAVTAGAETKLVIKKPTGC